MSNDLSVYIPIDRCHAIAGGRELPNRSSGAVLFADVVGFTPLAEALAQALGPRRGAEELTNLLNRVYDLLVTLVHEYGGSVVGFSGDAMTCWFDAGEHGPRPGAGQREAMLRAFASAAAMQDAMTAFSHVEVAAGIGAALAVKIAVVGGPVRRFVVGDPAVQVHDVLAGGTLNRLASVAPFARSGEIVTDSETCTVLGAVLRAAEWRSGTDSRQRVAVLAGVAEPVPPAPWPPLAAELPPSQAERWVLPLIRERLRSEPGQFLAELRPGTALMLQFGGIDYEADQAHQQLDQFIRTVQHTLSRYEGVLIDITMADKAGYLYAVFGAPVVHEDDTRRAVLASAELLRALPKHALPRIGISRGTMRVGTYGGRLRHTYGALGDAVNLACRLMDAAPPGAAWCDYSVFRATERHVTFAEKPPVRVKGKAGMVRVYQPLATTPAPSTPTEQPLVGRRAETERFSACLDAIARGESRTLVIEGDAGIGKSRLVVELVRQVRGRGMVGLLGAGQSIEQHTPYRAWRDLFAAYFGLDEAASLAERTERVQAHMQEIAPEQLARASLLNDLLGLGIPEDPAVRGLDPALRAESLTALVTALFRRWLDEQPLVLVIEDAHWLDSRSWELLLRLGRALSELPLLLVVSMRSLDAGHPSLASMTALLRMPNAARVLLAPLDAGGTAQLAAARLGLQPHELPEPIAAMVGERSGGNPFFAEELASALHETGAIQVVEQRGAASGRRVVLGDVQASMALLPDTLQGLLLARLDKLSPEQQFTLKIAAVIGQTFAFEPLHYAHRRHAAVNDSQLKQQLRTLAARRFTELEAPDPELTYRFTHVLTQEAVYQKLLYAQRRDLHRTVATWYEDAAGGDSGGLAGSDNRPRSPYFPLLAHHYRHAEERERERHYAELAGLQAADQYANAEALAYLARALELTPADAHADRYRLLLRREQIYDLQSARDEQQRDLAALEALAAALDDQRRIEVALRRSNYAEKLNDFPTAIDAARQAVALAEAAGDTRQEAAAFLAWGMALVWWAQYEQAREPLSHAIALGRVAGRAEIESEALRGMGAIAEEQGAYPEAERLYSQSLELSRAAGDRQREGWMLNGLGILAEEQGHHARARAFYREALATFRAIGDRGGEASVLNNSGVVEQDCGNYTAARRYFEQSLAINRETHNRHGESIKLLNLGDATRRQGEYTAARTFYEQALAIAREIGNRHTQCEAITQIGATLLALGDHEPALTHIEHALAMARELGVEPKQARALTILARVYVEHGQLDAAHASFQEAHEIYQRIGKHHLAMEPLAGLAEVALLRGEPAHAMQHAEAIAAFLASMPIDGIDQPFVLYVTCERVLRAQGDPRADGLLQAGVRRLLQRADMIDDPLARRSYLEHVAAHRALMVRARGELAQR